MERLEEYTRKGQPWDISEDNKLRKEYISDKLTLLQICDIHKRMPGGIIQRLKKLNIIHEKIKTRGYSEYKENNIFKEINKNNKEQYEILKKEKPVVEVNSEGYFILKDSQTDKLYLLQFDGASDPNPGPSAGGAVLFHPGTTDPVFERYEFIPHATNNEAEYNGLIIGLQEAADAGIKNLLIEGDSNLIINQFAGTWKIKAENLASLHKKARALLTHFDFVAIKHIPREKNAHADRLTNEGVKEKDSVLRLFES